MKREDALKIADLVMNRIERDQTINRDALADEIAAGFMFLPRRFVTLASGSGNTIEECIDDALKNLPSPGLGAAYWNLIEGMSEARQAVEQLLKRHNGKFGT